MGLKMNYDNNGENREEKEHRNLKVMGRKALQESEMMIIVPFLRIISLIIKEIMV